MPLTGGVAKRSAKISNNTYLKLFVNQNKKYAGESFEIQTLMGKTELL